VAKKKTAPKNKTPARSATRQTDDQGEFDSAADALRAAQEELHKAQAHYQAMREQAAEKIEEIRSTTVGDMVDGALEIVRKHPGPSLLAALAAGFMLDRWLRK
jgi:Arc/MetJ-type ribon-helix-helix transcriptional regulator